MLFASMLLGLAIVVEVSATAMLPRTESFTRPVWTVVVLGGYAVSIWLLARVVQTMPVSVAYAVWAGAGTALVAVIGVMLLHEHMDLVRGFGLAAIVVGVVLVNLHPAR